MNKKRIIFDVSVVGGGKILDMYSKRCREFCIHYDDVIADCYLGNSIYEKCDCYKPKSTGFLNDSIR